MSWLSVALNWGKVKEFFRKLIGESTHAIPLLEALERNDYAGGAAIIRQWGSVAEAVEQVAADLAALGVPREKVEEIFQRLAVAGLQGLDHLIPEEQVLKVVEMF